MAALMLALIIAGCGKTNPLLAPTTGTEAAGITTPEHRGDADEARDDDRDDGTHAVPITGPTTITRSGHYRLVEDLEVTNGDGIVITASDVRLWLGRHRLSGPGNKAGRAIVIDGGSNVSVSGGRIERFGFGVVLMGASHCRVRDLVVQGGDEAADPAAGNPPQVGIMLINSSENRLSGNRLRDVNLGIFVRGAGSHGNHIRHNVVVGGDHGLLAICYNPAPGSDPAGPREDIVEQNFLARFGTGIAASSQSERNVFARNVIRYFVSAWTDLNGTNVFRDNRAVQITP
jgi:parallel beta-helix repeat protein